MNDGVDAATSLPPADSARWSPFFVVNVLSATAIAFALAWTLVASSVRIGVDPQLHKCLPHTVYLLRLAHPDTLVRGNIYQYRAASIPRVPDGTAMAKIAAGIPGDHVVVNADGLFVNNVLWGPLDPGTLARASMTVADVQADYIIPPGKLLMAGTLERSWDGRYWGLIDASQVIGRAYPLW